MKRFITSLLVVFSFLAIANAQNGNNQNVDFQIVAQDNISTPIYRSPVDVPITGYYVSSCNMLFLSFAYDLGDINVVIENAYTGEYLSETISTNMGVQSIPLREDEGYYTIIISIPNGLRYVATLIIY